MSGLYPQPVFTQPEMPSRALSTLATADPTVVGDAIGRVPENSCVAVEVNKACVITIFTWMPTSGTWKNPGSAASSYQKTFTAAGWDYFVCPPGAKFALKSDTASTTAWTSAPAV